MLCPRCQQTLQQTQRMGIEIDYCPACRGVWLDSGELDKMIDRTHDAYPSTYAPDRYPGPDPSYRKETSHDPYRNPQRHESSRYREESQHYEDRYHHRDHDDRGHHHDRHRKPYKKKGFLGELFDIFD